MWVFGPDLHFDASGRQLRDEEKTHFWYPSLSNKLGEDTMDRFLPLSFKPDPSNDLTVLLEAARPPQTWPCLLTNAIYLSGTASFFVRMVTKQYPVGILVGDKGVGKTFAMDVSARFLTGVGEDQKLNQLIDVWALLHHTAFTSQPVTLEDNDSLFKEEKLVVAVFDKQQYIAQGKAFPVLCTVVLATNNIFK